MRWLDGLEGGRRGSEEERGSLLFYFGSVYTIATTLVAKLDIWQ